MSSGRSSRVKMRSRPIDVNKALFLCDTSQREPDEQEIEQAWAAMPGNGGGGHGGGHHSSGHTGQGDGMIVGVGIPTPPIHIDPDYHKRLDYGKFIQPSYYIKAHQTAGTGLINHLDRYDLLKEDIEWLSDYNKAAEAKRPPGPTMTEDEMEKMIDLFEKEAGKITLNGMRAEMMSIEDKIDPRKDFPLVRAIVIAAQTIHVRTKILEPVYEYWIDKRKRLGKALMRQYQEPPPRGNTDPHVAFRPRTEGRRISKRNPRKDDHSGYHKMNYLKRDFQKILDIIDSVQIREQLKREQTLLAIHIFDAKLQATPWAAKLLKEQPVIQQAIGQQLALPPPSSTMAGAPSPTLPSILQTASPDLLHLYRLLHSNQPVCTYTRAEFEAEHRRRRAQNQHARAAAHAAASGHHGGHGHGHGHHGGHGGQKRGPNVISIKRPGAIPSGGADGQKMKLDRKGTRGGVSSLDDVLARFKMDEPEDLELTDEEGLLSEDEEDARFYDEVEQHVKRMKIERTSEADGNFASAGGHRIEPFRSTHAHHSPYPSSLHSHGGAQPASNIGPNGRLIPATGGKVGYVSGIVGRGGLVWLEATYTPPAHLLHHHPHAHAPPPPHSHGGPPGHSHAHPPPASSGHPGAFGPSGGVAPSSNKMQITVSPPTTTTNIAHTTPATSTAAPMDTSNPHEGGTSTMPTTSTAIKVQ